MWVHFSPFWFVAPRKIWQPCLAQEVVGTDEKLFFRHDSLSGDRSSQTAPLKPDDFSYDSTYACMHVLSSRVARFFLVQYTQLGKIWYKNIPNNHKIKPMTAENTNRSKKFQNFPIAGFRKFTKIFWFENLPSGSTAFKSSSWRTRVDRIGRIFAYWATVYFG
jgi:hypothetical protein